MNIRPNISFKEAACPTSGLVPNDHILDMVQDLRELCGFGLPITSFARTPLHNDKIGGSKYSAHLLCTETEKYGAVDIRFGNKGEQAKRRFAVIQSAYLLGFNNIEICNKHIHVGFVPDGHVMFNRLYWGKSK